MTSAATHLEKFPFGIAGAGLSEIERQVPDGEPPPLPANEALQVIGKPVHRHDGRAKVTGAVRFTVDVKLPGMMYARILRSASPNARVRSVDTIAATRLAGVRAILVIAPKDSVLRYAGAPIAAVAAATPAVADAAVRLIRVDAVPLPFVVDMDIARRANAALVYQPGEALPVNAVEIAVSAALPLTGNVRGPETQGSRGNVEQGFVQSEVVVESEYRTHTQTHCCMEPHAIVAGGLAG